MQDRFKFRRPIFTTGNLFCGFQHAEIRGGQLAITGYEGIVELNEFLTFGDWEQCTGLKDKNGNLIYEGDKIIKRDFNALGYDRTRKSIVFWHEKGYWSIETEFGDVYWLGEFEPEQLEIIGNIHTATVKDGE